MNTTINSTVASELTKLDTLIKAISEHPKLEDAIEVDEHGVRWLQMCNICNEHIHAEPSMVELLNQLNGELCGLFIDDQGQHSALFYKASKRGYRMRTGERDSFGPLSSIMTHASIDWQVAYG